MSLIDLFNPSFLLFLGILVLVAALLVVYFESKSREQNHKISSMFSIVSTLAEDLNSVKLAINQIAFNEYNTNGGASLANNITPFNISEQDNLIEVSDDEEDSDSGEEEDSEEEDSDSEEEDSDSEEEDSDSDSENNNIKVLKIDDLDPLLEKVEENFEDLDPLLEKVEENFDDLDPLLEKVEQKFDNLEENLDSEYDKETFEEEPLQLVENDFVTEEIIKNDKNEKSIKIDLGDVINEYIDYKKLNLQKLKSIVIEKGLSIDTSKLKKPDLLKLLGVE